MSKKLLSHGFKLFKFSTWTVGILSLIVVLFVVTIMAFPVVIKASLETQLSELSDLDIKLSNPYLKFSNGGLFLQIDKLEATNIKRKNLVLVVDNLEWELQPYSLLNDIYSPSRIFINTLTFDLDAVEKKAEFFIKQVQRWVTLPNSEVFNFFEVLEIDKTFIKGEQNIEIAPLSIRFDNKQFTLKVTGQSLNPLAPKASRVDIVATLPSIIPKNAMLNLPILISSKDFAITTNIKFSSQAGDNMIEFESFLQRMSAHKVANYLSPQLLGSSTYTWIKSAFLAGTLQDLKLKIKKNLSKSDIAQVQFNSQLKDMELAFNPEWEPLKKLNASFQIDGKKMTIMVHNTKLNDVLLNDVNVQIDDISQKNLAVKVVGKMNAQSEHMVEFLKRSPLHKSVHEALNFIDLSGQADADVALIIPLDESAAIVEVDLTLKSNRLSVLNDKVVVEDYNAKVAFYNNEITAVGVGNIRDILFDIRINPSDKPNDNERIFGVELIGNNNFRAYITKQLDQSWRAKIDAKGIKGNVAVFLNDNDMLNVRLLDVQITALDAIQGDWKITPKDLPDMHLSAQNIYFDQDVLPNFSAKLFSKDNLLTIKDLQFEGINIGNQAISFHGFWVDGRTRLYAKVKGENLAEFFQQLKIKEAVIGGEFDFDIRLSCECDPWNMNYQNITGYFDMNVKKGVFTEKDPNIGRILSILNIKSIAKRLNLNFSDVVNKGFTYEGITMQLYLQNAIAKIKNFNLEALSSNIELTGQSHIINQQYDLVAKITPAINDAVPIVTYLTGGGLIGLGVWAVDATLFRGKLINKVVDKIIMFEYKITGLWDKPVIQEY